jgi:hypothetical protein
MKTALIILLAALVALNFLDYVSTTLVISKGRGTEANPIMQFFMKILGKYWWVSKVIIVLPIALTMLFYVPADEATIGAAVLDAMFAYVVVSNYKIAWRQ